MFQLVRRLFPALVLAATVHVESSAEQWNRFRGPNGSGVSTATGVPVKWTEEDYNWRIKLPGVGHSSPVLWNDLLVLTCGEEETGKRNVLGIDAASGNERWRREFAATVHRKHKLNSFASSTPAIDDKAVYTCWASPEEFLVIAVDHAGKQLWRVPLGPLKTGHGHGVSPIVHDNLVIVPKEHEGDSEIVALDCATGEVRWRAPRKSKATWSTPCVRRRTDGRDELIFVSWTHGITALDPKTGGVNWETDVFDKAHVESTIGSPVLTGDLVLGLSGWLAVRQEVVAVRPSLANGQSTVERVYTIDRGAPLCTTPLVVGNLLFLWADDGIVTCADVRSGEVHWRRRVGGTFYASPIGVGGRIYNVSADGEVIVLSAEKQYELLARNPLGESSHSTPAIGGGVMYLRTFSQLVSIGRN
jgi:outer membrane protein assembly factor BamB